MRQRRYRDSYRALACSILTPAGRELRVEAEKIPRQVVEKLGMPVVDLEELHAVLSRLIAASDQDSRAPASPMQG